MKSNLLNIRQLVQKNYKVSIKDKMTRVIDASESTIIVNHGGSSATTPPPPKASCWSNIVKKEAPPPQQPSPLLETQQVLEDARNSHGISVAIVDANAVIASGEKLHSIADKFVSVPKILEEICDLVSRHKLSFLPFTIQTMEPTPESINKVVKFARVIGDLQTLSDVDIKLMALTYTLEVQIHETKHLREENSLQQKENSQQHPVVASFVANIVEETKENIGVDEEM
ncbi:RNA-binding NOB1-like protein [Vicia villosa]|uniref:RNA-binding NOB1-like protein n=1 Tax=Vicia villosa TaxID=3911 RepID=UPI00273C3A72|nr:RNA-binding NOB1-like protein [Vicia villosa]